MDLYEMETALIDGYTLTYIDSEYKQCYIKYVGADMLELTKETSYREEKLYVNMPSLLTKLDKSNIDVNIF